MALTDNLISYWKLDEASGDALDAHGSNTLADNNTVGAGTGIISGARDFEDANSEYFSCSSNSSLNVGTGAFSFAGWVKAESVGSTYKYIVLKSNSSSPYEGFGLWNHPTLGLSVEASSGTFADSASSNTGLSDLGWHHVVLTRSGTTYKIYLDGSEIHSVTLAGAGGNLDNTGSLLIGGPYNPGDPWFWDGLICEKGFWKRALSGDEVTELYNAGAGLAYPFSGGGGGANSGFFSFFRKRRDFPGWRQPKIFVPSLALKP